MDRFEFFFTFYGLILGLAAAEILSSLGAFVRARPLRSIEIQSALLAFLTFLVICATWIDAWITRDTFELSFASMFAPIGSATAYYLAAVVVLPKEETDYDSMGAYFLKRKNFVVSMLLAAEVFQKIVFLPIFAETLKDAPAVFWLLMFPVNLALFTLWGLLLIARRRRVIIAGIILQIVVFTIPYWSAGWASEAIARAYGYDLNLR